MDTNHAKTPNGHVSAVVVLRSVVVEVENLDGLHLDDLKREILPVALDTVSEVSDESFIAQRSIPELEGKFGRP